MTLAENCILKKNGKEIIITFTGCKCTDWKQASIPDEYLPFDTENVRNIVLFSGSGVVFKFGLVQLAKAGHKYSMYYDPGTYATDLLDKNDKYTIHGELVYFIK